MTAKQRMAEIGEQFQAERVVFNDLRAAAIQVDGVTSFMPRAEPPHPSDAVPEPKGLLPGEFWFWFAGCHYRVRHVFKELGQGQHASAIEVDAPLAPEDQQAHKYAFLFFDRHGEIEWTRVGLCGPMLKERPDELLFALLTRQVKRDPAGKVPEPLEKFRKFCATGA